MLVLRCNVLLYCAEIMSVQTHAERALQELAAVREQEQALLKRQVEILERQFKEGVADLEQRFLMQACSHPPLPAFESQPV